MLNLSQVEPYYELLTPMASNHTPTGSLDQATVDQWLHAIATKSQLFCNTAITTPKALKDDVVKILKRHKFYTNRNEFYERVFGDLDLKPTVEPTFRFICRNRRSATRASKDSEGFGETLVS